MDDRMVGGGEGERCPHYMSYPNHEQAAVLSHLDGTLLVLAPAGTGKTRLMAERLARNQGV